MVMKAASKLGRVRRKSLPRRSILNLETNVVEPNDDSTCFDDSHELQMASTFKWQTSTSSGWWRWHLNGNITTGARRLNVNCPKIALNGTTSL